jgi:hypothetical protein
MGHQEEGCQNVDWINLAQDIIQSRTLVILRIPREMRNVLSGSVTLVEMPVCKPEE